jgi:REP element-mobilizing transposase RayT
VTVARRHQISLEHTRFYHCTSRCVWRAFLCGRDRLSGRSFEHRRRWIEDRLKLLVQVFAIELIAYAVMHNHYHVILCVDPDQAARWDGREVRRRWGCLFKVPEPEDLAAARVSRLRERLHDIGWFMRCLNEYVARKANREEDCGGRFWEGRYKLRALVTCMAYVDLNPIRAGIAALPERSDYTSIKARVGGDAEHLVPFRP